MITPAEWEVMRIVWANDQVTSQKAIDLLSQTFDWSQSTIKTLLGRLVKKNYLRAEKEGRLFVYQAQLTEEAAVLERLQDNLDHTCNKEKGQLLGQLLEKNDLSKSDALALIKILQGRLDSLPDQVDCHCAKGQCRCGHHH